MSRITAGRDAWHPQTALDRDAILRELQEVVSSPHFCNSKRYPALLQYIVENTLAGNSDLLKERTLGVEVFDRPPTYDTNADTVVRYTAGEVRKRLLLYYSEHGTHSGIRISLPAGSYIPEFLHGHDELEEIEENASPAETHFDDAGPMGETAGHLHEHETDSHSATAGHTSSLAPGSSADVIAHSRLARPVARRMLWLALVVIALVAIAAALNWRYRAVPARTVVDDFWAPILRDQRTVVVCTGGVVFAQNNFSGVITAGKDIDYPFVSMQNASAIARISGLLERSGATTQLVFGGSEPLTELREHSVAMIGGYNNQWTMRLLQPLRFYFPPEPIEAIVDRMHPGTQWSRDKQLPYSSGDDYAIVARFRDPTIDGWVIVLAGLGRNGTEAAAQFATSPHYMQLLRDQVGSDFSNRNIEVVLKVRVIDGKTGAPSILAVHSW